VASGPIDASPSPSRSVPLVDARDLVTATSVLLA
jgi:hypothetical protein